MKLIRRQSKSRPAGGVHGAPSARALFPLKTIVAGVDFSKASKTACETALELAGQFGARLCLVHVVERQTFYDFDTFPLAVPDATVVRDAEKQLAEFARRAGHAEVPVFPEVREGRPWEEILETARKEKASLIVVGTHGSQGVQHLLLGSTAEKVVRHAACPVMVIPQGRPD